MNNKQKELVRILEVTINCCTFDTDKGTITNEEVLGNSRKQNVVMTRCMVALHIISFGYSINTCSMFLNRTEHSVRNLLSNAHNLLTTSRAFKIAYAESVLKLKDTED